MQCEAVDHRLLQENEVNTSSDLGGTPQGRTRDRIVVVNLEVKRDDKNGRAVSKQDFDRQGEVVA